MGHLHEENEIMTFGGFVVDNKTNYRTLQKSTLSSQQS